MKLVKLLVVVGVSVILQIGAVRYAEAQRGYDAIGGEILVFPSALFAGYKMLFPDEYLLYEEKEGEDA